MWYHRSFPFTVVATQLLHIALTSYGPCHRGVNAPCFTKTRTITMSPSENFTSEVGLNCVSFVKSDCCCFRAARACSTSNLSLVLGLWAASWLFQSWVRVDWYLWLFRELPAVLLRLWVGHQSIGFCVVLPVSICFLLLCGLHVPPCLSFAVDTVCETFVWCSASGIFVSSPDLWSVCPGQIQFGLVLPRVGGFGSLLLVPLCTVIAGGDRFDPFGKFVNYHKAITIPPFGTR